MPLPRMPKALRQQVEAAQREFNAPEAKLTRQAATAATQERAATRRSRSEEFAGQSTPQYQVKELLRQGEPENSSIDVDEKIADRRAPKMSWATNDLAHFDLAENLHNSISHSVNSLFGMGGYRRASREVGSDKIAQEAFGRLHKARLHLDAHWDAHTGTGTYSETNPEAAHSHLAAATKLMSQAIDGYSQHPTADDNRILGKSNAAIPAEHYDFDSAKKMLGALPSLYATHIQKTTGKALGAAKKIDVEDSYPAGKQIATFMGNDPTKKAKQPRRRKVKQEVVPPTEEEIAKKKQDADDVLNTWMSTVEERPEAAQGLPKSESPARRVSKQFTQVSRAEPVETAPSEQEQYKVDPKDTEEGNETPTWRETRVQTPLEKEHDVNVKSHRIEMGNHHMMMAIVHLAQGQADSPHLAELPEAKRQKATELAERVKKAANKSQMIGTFLSTAAQHKQAADSWYEKAVRTQRQLREEDNV